MATINEYLGLKDSKSNISRNTKEFDNIGFINKAFGFMCLNSTNTDNTHNRRMLMSIMVDKVIDLAIANGMIQTFSIYLFQRLKHLYAKETNVRNALETVENAFRMNVSESQTVNNVSKLVLASVECEIVSQQFFYASGFARIHKKVHNKIAFNKYNMLCSSEQEAELIKHRVSDYGSKSPRSYRKIDSDDICFLVWEQDTYRIIPSKSYKEPEALVRQEITKAK